MWILARTFPKVAPEWPRCLRGRGVADASIIKAGVQKMEDRRDADSGGRWQEEGGAFSLHPHPHVSLSLCGPKINRNVFDLSCSFFLHFSFSPSREITYTVMQSKVCVRVFVECVCTCVCGVCVCAREKYTSSNCIRLGCRSL